MRKYHYLKSTTARTLIIGLVLLATLLIFGISCQPSTPTPAPAPGPTPAATKVAISGFAFVPATITVPVGTTVTWTNKDSAAHTLSSRNDLFDSGSLSRDATFSYTFGQSGTFEYYCKFHPSMTGKITVE